MMFVLMKKVNTSTDRALFSRKKRINHREN